MNTILNIIIKDKHNKFNNIIIHIIDINMIIMDKILEEMNKVEEEEKNMIQNML